MSLPSHITQSDFLEYLTGVYPAPDATVIDPDETDLHTRLLTTAYNQLSQVYDLGSVNVLLQQFCVYAQALFLYREGDGLARRAALRAQGVASSGVAKETYRADASDIPICPEAQSALAGNSAISGVGVVQRTRERDDDELR